MNILFCNDSYPGKFESLASMLAADTANRVLFLSAFTRRDFTIPGVSSIKMRVKRDAAEPDANPFLREFEKIRRVGRSAYQTYLRVREMGFVPDMIFISSTDGLGLLVRSAFPESFIVSYFEDCRRIADSREDYERQKADMYFQSLQDVQSTVHFIMAEWQRCLLPPVLRKTVRVMPYYVDTEYFSPIVPGCAGTSGAAEVVSFNLKSPNLEIRKDAIPIALRLLATRPNCHVVLCLGSRLLRQIVEKDVSRLPEPLRSRISMTEFMPLDEYREVLRNSTLHICPDANEPPIREMLECLSCETLVMSPVQVTEQVIPLPREGRLEAVCQVLDNLPAHEDRRRLGREEVLARFEKQKVLKAHIASLMAMYARCRRK